MSTAVENDIFHILTSDILHGFHSINSAARHCMIDLHMASAVTPLPDYNLFIQCFYKATAICHGTPASIHNSYYLPSAFPSHRIASAFPSAHIYIYFFSRDFSPIFCVLSGPLQSVLVSKSKYKPKLYQQHSSVKNDLPQAANSKEYYLNIHYSEAI